MVPSIWDIPCLGGLWIWFFAAKLLVYHSNNYLTGELDNKTMWVWGFTYAKINSYGLKTADDLGWFTMWVATSSKLQVYRAPLYIWTTEWLVKANTFLYIYTQNMYTYKYIYIYIKICLHAPIYMYMYTYTYTFRRMLFIYIYMHIDRYVYIYICIYM